VSVCTLCRRAPWRGLLPDTGTRQVRLLLHRILDPVTKGLRPFRKPMVVLSVLVMTTIGLLKDGATRQQVNRPCS
jgi:hypothetical protein